MQGNIYACSCRTYIAEWQTVSMLVAHLQCYTSGTNLTHNKCVMHSTSQPLLLLKIWQIFLQDILVKWVPCHNLNYAQTL
jgi:hypothetical protein